MAQKLLPKYMTIPGWVDYTGQGRTSTYDAINSGHLKGVKLRSRTLIDVEAGLAWLASLPAAPAKSRAA